MSTSQEVDSVVRATCSVLGGAGEPLGEPAASPGMLDRLADEMREKLPDELVDELLAGAKTEEEIVGPSELLSQLTKRLVEATRALVVEHHAETTWLGVGLSVATLSICPWLGRAKLRLGAQLGSSATAGEGRQNLICAYLAVAVLIGLLANNLFGVWWLDPTVALGIAALALREGRRSWRGESCDCISCPPPFSD